MKTYPVQTSSNTFDLRIEGAAVDHLHPCALIALTGQWSVSQKQFTSNALKQLAKVKASHFTTDYHL